MTNSFDAEQGLAGGSAVNVQIKSGTNSLHGSAFEFHNDQFAPGEKILPARGKAKSKTIFNQFGGTLEGPIKRDKLFYFASYEGSADHRGQDGLATVPTAAIRTGDMSGSAVPVYDPATCVADGSDGILAPSRYPEWIQLQSSWRTLLRCRTTAEIF